jgi:hypothetical protein
MPWMQYLFLVVGIVAIAAFAPAKFTLSLFGCIALITVVVKMTAAKIMGPVSLGAAAKSVALACVLPSLVIIALLGLFHGQVNVEGFAALLLLSGLFASFVLGFKVSLGASFGASAGIAVVSTLVCCGLLILLKPFLF